MPHHWQFEFSKKWTLLKKYHSLKIPAGNFGSSCESGKNLGKNLPIRPSDINLMVQCQCFGNGQFEFSFLQKNECHFRWNTWKRPCHGCVWSILKRIRKCSRAPERRLKESKRVETGRNGRPVADGAKWQPSGGFQDFYVIFLLSASCFHDSEKRTLLRKWPWIHFWCLIRWNKSDKSRVARGRLSTAEAAALIAPRSWRPWRSHSIGIISSDATLPECSRKLKERWLVVSSF